MSRPSVKSTQVHVRPTVLHRISWMDVAKAAYAQLSSYWRCICCLLFSMSTIFGSNWYFDTVASIGTFGTTHRLYRPRCKCHLSPGTGLFCATVGEVCKHVRKGGDSGRYTTLLQYIRVPPSEVLRENVRLERLSETSTNSRCTMLQDAMMTRVLMVLMV
jgi:hypothetical protein